MDPTFNPSSWQHWALILSLVIFVAIGYSQAAAEDRRLRLLRQARATGQPSPQVNPPRRAAPPAQASRRPSSPGWLALNRYLPAPKRQRPEMDYIPERDDRAYGDSDPAYGQPAYGQPAYGQPAYSQPTYSQPTYRPPVPETPQPVVPRGNPFPEPVGTPFQPQPLNPPRPAKPKPRAANRKP